MASRHKTVYLHHHRLGREKKLGHVFYEIKVSFFFFYNVATNVKNTTYLTAPEWRGAGAKTQLSIQKTS